MATVKDVLNEIEAVAPVRWAFSFDNVGLLLGRETATVTRAVVSLDPSVEVAQYAKAQGAQLVICHHPILWMPVKQVTGRITDGEFALLCAENSIANIAAHTNWDAAPGGINDTLAGILGLEDVRVFGSAAEVAYQKIVVYVPTDYTQLVIDAMASAGAGNVGLYRRCAFTTHGAGTFEPLPGSEPFLGRVGKTEEVTEDRVEMICPARQVNAVLQAILKIHPYEQPAYDVLQLRPLEEQACGRIGRLASPMKLRDFVNLVQNKLGFGALGWGDPERMVQSVAVVGGSADGEWQKAQAAGADVFLTGEVRHHTSVEAVAAGLPIVAGGHFATEHPGMETLKEHLSERMPEIEWLMFTPPPGRAGQPLP
jgi:dinuclear metal center YbgI/SA1388 family protein